MNRSSLLRLFRRLLVVAPLPVALAACGAETSPSTTTGGATGLCGAAWEVPLPGGGPMMPDGGFDRAECAQLCQSPGHGPAFSCTVDEAVSPPVAHCHPDCTGRHSAGLRVAPPAPTATAAGAYFAEMAGLEAASVHAFRTLRDELAAHGAPRALRRAAGVAARDEVRHARSTAALARRHGAAPPPLEIAPTAPRTLAQIAEENAVEGCVRETFGALLAARQAQAARDPVVRAAMTRIARDEARHAALAWQVASWASSRLGPEERRRIGEARRAAALELIAAQGEPDHALAALAGLPSAAETRRLAAEMTRALWSSAPG